MTENGRLVARLACVGAVVCVVFPLGQLVFPAVTTAIDALPFTTLEAVVSTTLGFGLFDVLFG